MQKEKYQVTSLTEKGRSVSSVEKHIFLNTEKTLVCDKLRCALSLKKAKLLGETGVSSPPQSKRKV